MVRVHRPDVLGEMGTAGEEGRQVSYRGTSLAFLLLEVGLTHENLWRRRMFRPTRDEHHRTRCRMFRYRKNHQLASFQSMRAVPMCGLYVGALSRVQKKKGAEFAVLLAPSLTSCFDDGHVRRARPGKVVSMYMTSLSPCQKAKVSIAEALAVGFESEAPALELGRIAPCHSLVPQITWRGLLFDCMFSFSPHASQPA